MIKRLALFSYFRILHRVEWNGGWGRFIPLRNIQGSWRVGVGVECLETRWWVSKKLKTSIEKIAWPTIDVRAYESQIIL
jgi:hypothetical protein